LLGLAWLGLAWQSLCIYFLLVKFILRFFEAAFSRVSCAALEVLKAFFLSARQIQFFDFDLAAMEYLYSSFFSAARAVA
jgi:hypothetical protein